MSRHLGSTVHASYPGAGRSSHGAKMKNCTDAGGALRQHFSLRSHRVVDSAAPTCARGGEGELVDEALVELAIVLVLFRPDAAHRGWPRVAGGAWMDRCDRRSGIARTAPPCEGVSGSAPWGSPWPSSHWGRASWGPTCAYGVGAGSSGRERTVAPSTAPPGTLSFRDVPPILLTRLNRCAARISGLSLSPRGAELAHLGLAAQPYVRQFERPPCLSTPGEY